MNTEPGPAPAYLTARFTPPDGRTLFIIGQDTQTIDEYVTSVGFVPAGVTGYTSVIRLDGIHGTGDDGAGPQNLDHLASTYPNSVIIVGLYLVDFLPQISSGHADSLIDSLLDVLTAYDRPVYVRFGYEFDGSWNHYKPEDYVAAWQYFYKRFQLRGVANIALVWQSAAFCGGTFDGHPIDAWYPGDEYVDWIGFSYFVQQADCGGRPFDEILAFARAHRKPVMIAESAPQRYQTGALTYSVDGSNFVAKSPSKIWDEWYAPYFQYIQANRDVIRAVHYINTYWDSQPMWGPPYTSGYWGDSRVQANPVILEKWQQEIKEGHWLQAGPQLFSLLGYTAPSR